MIIPEKHVCDFCREDVDELHTGLIIPVLTYCDWTEGKSSKIHVEFTKYDICNECLIKSTNVIVDFQGSNPRFIK